MNLNTIVTSDNIEYLKTLPDGCIDFVLTSPPYDGLRDYNGYSLNLHGLGEQLFRVLKDGGMCDRHAIARPNNIGTRKQVLVDGAGAKVVNS